MADVLYAEDLGAVLVPSLEVRVARLELEVDPLARRLSPVVLELDLAVDAVVAEARRPPDQLLSGASSIKFEKKCGSRSKVFGSPAGLVGRGVPMAAARLTPDTAPFPDPGGVTPGPRSTGKGRRSA